MHGFFLLGILHALAALSVLVGIVFLLVFAIKALSEKELKKWGLRLLIGGLIICALTGIVSGMTMRSGKHMMKGGMMMKNGEMMKHEMMDDDAMMEMSMDDMAEMLDGKTGDEFDQAFIEGMIPHHQGAIDMANDALKSAKHEELKKMARDIISSQQKEIDMMKKWESAWGFQE